MNPQFHSNKTTLNRADLLRAWKAGGDDALENMAFAMGYERKEAPVMKTYHAADRGTFRLLPLPPPEIEEAQPPAPLFFRITERKLKPQEQQAQRQEPPDWFKQAKPLTQDERPEPAALKLPAPLPLTRWARLWPFLRRALGVAVPSQRLDTAKLLRQIGKGEVLHRLPWLKHQQWSGRICVLVDYQRHTQPYREDFNALCRALAKWHGEAGLDIRILHGEPGRHSHYRRPLQSRLHPWQMPDADTLLLILSDFGLLESSEQTTQAWRLFGRHSRAAGCQTLALCPVPAYQHEAGLRALFRLQEWDRQSRFQRGGTRISPAEPTTDGAETLLALAAPAILIEPALLRALRHLLPASEADVAAEAQVWTHPDTHASSQGCCFANLAAIERYQARFKALEPELKQQAVALIQAHHADQPASVRYAELDVCERLLPGCLDEPTRQAVQEWKRAMVKTISELDYSALRLWQKRHLARQTEDSWKDNPELAALWAIAQREKLAQGETLELPPCVSAEQTGYFLEDAPPEPRTYRLSLQGRQLLLEADGLWESRSFLGEVAVGAGVYLRLEEIPPSLPFAKGGIQTHIPITQDTVVLAELNEDFAWIELETDSETLRIDNLQSLLDELDDPNTEPPRRLEIGDRLAELGDPRPGVGTIEIEAKPSPLGRGLGEGLFPKEIQALMDEINDPQTEPTKRLEIGDELEKLGDPRRGVGLDENGLPDIDWVEIPGGSFVYQDGEIVELPTFWISRYPVTNRQFQAFIDAGGYNNPEKLLDKMTGKEGDWWQGLKKPKPEKPRWPQGNRPRTDVDWYEAVAFSRWLGSALDLPADTLRLPTEQEWEKAARGESGLVYPWGDEYQSGFANINETWGGKGPWNLSQTTAVGIYPQGQSPYGIEDMAGEVWEWCLNKYYDPNDTGIDSGGRPRVLRGGSWFNASVSARAGYRLRLIPVNRYYDLGFRLLSSAPIAR